MAELVVRSWSRVITGPIWLSCVFQAAHSKALNGATRRCARVRWLWRQVRPLCDLGTDSFGIVYAAPHRQLIVVDIRPVPGNSGRPLAERVVGINCMVANGMAIAVSTAALERFLKKHLGSREGTG